MSGFTTHEVITYAVRAPNGMTVARLKTAEDAAKVAAHFGTVDLTQPAYRFMVAPSKGQPMWEVSRRDSVTRALVVEALHPERAIEAAKHRDARNAYIKQLLSRQ